MSLESQIAALVSAANSLTSQVAGKMSQIDQKVESTATEISKVITSNRVVTYYVDEASGNDANTGSQSSPLKSVSRAMVLAPSGSTLNISVKPGRYITTSSLTCYASQIYVSAWDAFEGLFPQQYGDNTPQVPYIEFKHLVNLRIAGSLIFGAFNRGLRVVVSGEGGFYCFSACNVSFDRTQLTVESVNAVFGGGVGGQSGDVFQRYSPTKLSFRTAAVNMIRGYIARAPIMISVAGVTGFATAEDIIQDASEGSVLSTIPKVNS